MTSVLSRDELSHIGVLRKSGRYPWGSGSNPHQRSRDFLATIDSLRKQGLSEKDIIAGLDLRDSKTGELYNSTQYRALKGIANQEYRAGQVATAVKLKETGMSPTAIGREMGVNESTVRGLLAPSSRENANIVATTASKLKDSFTEDSPYLDIGRGVEQHMGVSKGRLDTAVATLKEEGYEVMYVKTKQLGTGNDTSIKVLVPPGTQYKDLAANSDKISAPGFKSDDNGRDFIGLRPIQNLDPKRVSVRYAEEGGAEKDGVIELRRGVDDLNIGGAKYAQVRIGVAPDRYLKGMAVYSDDLPDGVDVRFNTNKSDTGNKLDAMKGQKKLADGSVDMENPFGASIKPGGQRGALNIISEEGDWSKWSKNLSSQMLSKQTPELAKKQLELTFKIKKDEFDEINALTNPEVKKKLLDSFADDADASSVHLKAAGLPRTATHVILPIPSMKDTEIFAPNYKDGEKVVLIRHPHGGTFEIPELTVNNKNRAAKAIMAQAKDAVGINSKVAGQLSGADFDGDTVLVIPNAQSGSNRVMVSKPLDALKGFDPQSSYPGYPGMKKVGEPGGGSKQQLMGDVSNLITDMSALGAPPNEIARAVKHSMVVIDAEKHGLDHKRSAKENGINELKRKYQGGANKGAATLISRASSETSVLDRKARSAADGGAIDKATGKKMFVETGRSYERTKTNPKTGEVTTETVFNKIKSKKMAETDDAYTLVSDNGSRIERVYANHANSLKALANEARRVSVNTPSTETSKAARTAYEPEYQSLRAKLNLAKSNAPLERKAQLLANAEVRAKRQADPSLEKDEIKKLESQALTKARLRTGASKQRIDITDREWEAIQSGAVAPSFLREILANTDVDKVKTLATPRTKLTVTPAKLSRAKGMLDRGYTQAEIASALGLAPSTLNDALNG